MCTLVYIYRFLCTPDLLLMRKCSDEHFLTRSSELELNDVRRKKNSTEEEGQHRGRSAARRKKYGESKVKEETKNKQGRGRNTEWKNGRGRSTIIVKKKHSTEELVKTQTKKSVLAVSAALGM